MKRLEFSKNTIQGSFWGILNRFIAVFLPFVVRTIIIRRLGTEYAGLSSLLTSILQVLSLAELGFASAMVYEMYKPIAKNNWNGLSALLNYYRKIYIIIGCIVLSVGLCIVPIIRFLISGGIPQGINIYILYFIYLTNTALSYFAFSYRASVMTAYQREADNAKIQLINNSLMYAVQITVLLLFTNYYVYIIFLPVFTLSYNYLRYLYAKKHYPQIVCKGEISNTQRQSIKKNISALFLHKVGNVTVNTLDNIIISSFLGLRLLSNYNNYYYVISAVTSLILIFFNSIKAGVGNRLIVGEKARNLFDFYNIFYINCVVVTVCTTCLFGIFQDFITLWVGKEYLFSEFTMLLICVYFFIHTIRQTIIAYRDAAGMWIDNKWQPIVSAILNLTLNIILIQQFGVNGVIISTIVSMSVIDIPWETEKLIHNLFDHSTKKYYFRLIAFFTLTIINCVVVRYITLWVEVENIFGRIILKGLIALVISSALMVLFTFRLSEFQFMCRFINSVFRIYEAT